MLLEVQFSEKRMFAGSGEPRFTRRLEIVNASRKHNFLNSEIAMSYYIEQQSGRFSVLIVF